MALQENVPPKRSEPHLDTVTSPTAISVLDISLNKLTGRLTSENQYTKPGHLASDDDAAPRSRFLQEVKAIERSQRESQLLKGSAMPSDKAVPGDTSETMYSGREDKSPGLPVSKQALPPTTKTSLSKELKAKVSQTWDRVKQSTGFLKKQSGHKSYKYYSSLE